MAVGNRSVTLNDKDGKPAYEIKLALSGDNQGGVQIEQKQLSFNNPFVSIEEITEAVALLNQGRE
jgi:hypothetical protein